MSNNQRFYLTKRNNGIYYVGWREGEKIRWKSTRCDKKPDAISFLNSFRIDEIKTQEVPLLTELWKNYSSTQAQRLRKKTIDGYEWSVNSFISVCGDKQIDRYTLQDVERFKQFHLSRGLSLSSVNIHYRSIKVLFNFAIRHEIISKSPFAKSSQLKVPQRAPVYMTSEDMQKLLAKVDVPILRDIFRFAALTGLRLNELTNMKWSQIDFKNKQLTVENTDTFLTKSGRIRTVPLSDSALTILKCLQSEPPSIGYVFVKTSGYKFNGTFISHKFKEFVKLAELNESLHFHSLRHTCASHLVSAGVSLYSVQIILGHSNISTTMAYSHLSQNSLQDSINKIQI